MQEPPLPIHIIDSVSGNTVDALWLDWIPHPGNSLEIGGHVYTILEKRHSYQLRDRSYQLSRIRLLVQLATNSGIPGNQGYIGEWSCLYNARSPLLRCAVNPLGPCESCPQYQPS